MPTRVFLCWSGPRSQKFAEVVKEWLPRVLGENVQGSMSTQIEKGAEWFDGLRKALDSADCGILCFTPEAIESPWIHFEAGLLVRALSQGDNTEDGEARASRVFPLLHGVRGDALTGPLGAYQGTVVADFDDVVRLLESIDQFIPQNEKTRSENIRRSCRRQWAALQAALEGIPRVAVTDIVPDFEKLFQRKTFQEPMPDCLNQNWLDRYNGARDTYNTLKNHQDTVRKACRPFLADIYDGLLAALDGYTMGLSKLLGKPESPLDPKTGQLIFDSPGIAIACERHRKRARSLVDRIVEVGCSPLFEEVFRFEIAETFEEKKRLVHRKTDQLQKNNWFAPDETRKGTMESCANSDWELERILYFVWREKQPNLRFVEELAQARRELERAQAKREGVSLMPLSYALGPVEAASSTPPYPHKSAIDEFQRLEEDIRSFIERTESDKGGQVRASLKRIEKLLSDAGPKTVTAGQP